MHAAAHHIAMLVGELRRRRVFRVATVYIAIGLGVVYAADVILPRLAAPDWTVTLVIVLAGLGLFIALGLAWAFDVTPGGVVRTAAAPPIEARPIGAAPIAAAPAEAVQDTLAALDRRAIAVLPFENMSADADTDYFSDGISEEIINALAQLPELRVAGRTSAFTFKGRHEDLRDVGRKLNVGTVLEGSVRRVGDRVRITTQLVDTTDGYHLWSERYDRDLHDIFAVQDEIARAIADHLAVKLGARASAPLIAPHPADPEAYALFLRGRHHQAQLMEPGFSLAIEAFEAAIARAPDYALAYAGIADSEIMRGVVYDEEYARSPSRARAAALRALELNDRIAEAHATLGAVLTYFDLDWAGAERSFRRALELEPGSAWAHTWYGDLLAYTGRTDESIAEARRALEIEPLASLFRWNLIQNLWFGGHCDEADRESQHAIQLFPDAWFPHFFLSMTSWTRGAGTDAIAGIERVIERVGRESLFLMTLASICYHFGLRERADALYAELRERSESEHVSAGAFFLMHLARGETDEAIRWLRAGRANRDGYFAQLKATVNATPLAMDPSLAAEFDRLGFP